MFSSVGNTRENIVMQQLRRMESEDFKLNLNHLSYNCVFELYELLKRDKNLWSNAGYCTESEEAKLQFMIEIYPELKLIN